VEGSAIVTTEDDQLAEFARQVSHDLMNPLAAVRLSLELIREELDSGDPGLLDLLTRAERGVLRMADLIVELSERAQAATEDPLDA